MQTWNLCNHDPISSTKESFVQHLQNACFRNCLFILCVLLIAAVLRFTTVLPFSVVAPIAGCALGISWRPSVMFYFINDMFVHKKLSPAWQDLTDLTGYLRLEQQTLNHLHKVTSTQHVMSSTRTTFYWQPIQKTLSIDNLIKRLEQRLQLCLIAWTGSLVSQTQQRNYTLPCKLASHIVRTERSLIIFRLYEKRL